MKGELIRYPEPEKAKPVQGEHEQPSQGLTKTQRKNPRRHQRWQEAHPGLRGVSFIIDTAMWERFVQLYCRKQRPNEIFTRMIYNAVAAKGPFPPVEGLDSSGDGIEDPEG